MNSKKAFSPKTHPGFSPIVRFVALLTVLGAATRAGAADDAKDINALLDRIESAWAAHDADALARCVSDRGFAAVVSRPDHPEGAWVGDKKALLAALGNSWTGVVGHKFVERDFSIDYGMAVLRLTVEDQLADSKTRKSRVVNVAVKEGGQWKICFSMPEVAPSSRPADPTSVRQSIEGRLVGVGVGLEAADGGAKINKILPQSPAENAGLEVGWLLTAVDGKTLAGLSIDEIVQRIRGPEGEAVSLTLKRPDGSTRTVELVRESVNLASVETRELKDGLFVVRISAFTNRTLEETRAAIRNIRSNGAKGIILDLRGPCGGTPDAARAVAGLLAPAGTPLWGVHLDGKPDQQFASAGPLVPQMPCVVLIDGKTAGAGTLVAYALKHNGRAKLIGQQTPELTRMKALETGPDGRGRLVENGHFLSPDGKSLVGHGVQPDVPLEADLGEAQWIEKAAALLREAVDEKPSPAGRKAAEAPPRKTKGK